MSIDTPTMAVPPFCNPDEPPEAYNEYPRNFDMVDTEQELAWWPLLRKPLEIFKRIVLEAYEEANQEAMKHQDRHRKFAYAAALFGTAAVVLAIFQLAFPGTTEWLGHIESKRLPKVFTRVDVPTLEAVSALAAFIAVFLWVIIAFRDRWLLERHKAERYRLLKFRFLLDPDFWCDDERFSKHEKELGEDVQRVRRMTDHDFREWVEELGQIAIPQPPESCTANAEALRQLVDYYRVKRLVNQRVYFKTRERQNVSRAWLTGWLGPVLFFASVLCVFLHLVFERIVRIENLHEFGRVFIFLAAVLPTLGAGVRTFTGAHEFARNKVRYHAKRAVLSHVDNELKKAKDADARLRDMAFCEQTLELEHREWTRLMIETEIFP